MAKKKAVKPKYVSFKLHGKYPTQKVIMYAAVDLIISLALGFFLQAQVASAFAFK